MSDFDLDSQAFPETGWPLAYMLCRQDVVDFSCSCPCFPLLLLTLTDRSCPVVLLVGSELSLDTALLQFASSGEFVSLSSDLLRVFFTHPSVAMSTSHYG